MLIELWEKFRGYDKWTETEATAEKSDARTSYDPSFPVRHRDVLEEWTSSDVLKFIDSHGETQRLAFTVHGDSPLFQLVDGSKIKIRYNPENSDEYYLRELFQTRVRRTVKWSFLPLLLLGIVIFFRC